MVKKNKKEIEAEMKSKYFLSIVISTVFFSSCIISPKVRNNRKVSRDGLVLYLNVDGGKITDQSFYERPCEIHGAQIKTDSSNKSYIYFNGVDNYIKIKDSLGLTPKNQKLTISFWVDVMYPGNKFILYKGSTQYNREYAVGIREDSLLSFQLNNNGNWLERSSVASSKKIDNDKWMHVTCVWDGYTQKIYINSKLSNEIISDPVIQDFGSDLYIGTYGGSISQYAFHGALDDLFVYNRVLDQGEIRLLMDNQIE